MLLHCDVQPDHLEKIANSKRPMLAIAELIWNALDADATRVNVELVRNPIKGIEIIRVNDNGHGITPERAREGFSHLGGSWKKQARRTRGGRILHGKDGQGRFKAFGLGNVVLWKSRYQDEGAVSELTISGARSVLTDMDVSEPARVMGKETGTVVEVRQITQSHRALDDAEGVANDLAMRFALYLREYPKVEIRFDGVRVDQRDAEAHCIERDLPAVRLENGASYPAKLVVIEWKIDAERALYLCDIEGVVVEKLPPGVQEPGFVFTAYLKSEAVTVLESQGAFGLDELHADVRKLQAAAKVGLKAHFRARRAQLAYGLIEQWKAERIYPFEGEPKNLIERTEREVFDVVAKNVNDYLPDFETADAKSKRFSLRLLKEVMESSPSATKWIIREVLELPAEQATDLAELLQRTTLTAIINASKTVTDRLDLLGGLEMLLFNPKSKEQLLERAQLQKILEQHPWLWGEQFALSAADRSLSEVLVKHLELLGRNPGGDREDEVLLPDGGRGIVDLMLSRCFLPQAEPEAKQHLIVELKRPSQRITRKVLDQINDYALAVAADERFRDTNTQWEFWAVSNEIDEAARQRVKQKDRPFGLLAEYDEPARIRVYAVNWARVLDAAKVRLRFYKEKLEYSVNDESALSYLHKVHEKYLPPVLASETEARSQ